MSRTSDATAAGNCYQCKVKGKPLAPGKLRCADCIRRAVEFNRRKRKDPNFVKDSSARASEWNRKNPERRKAAFKKEARNLRIQVREHYGGVCACCGEGRAEFLTIDHIGERGVGTRHRKRVGCVYRWLRMYGYPDGFRVMCYNCNLSAGFFGECPHVGERRRVMALAKEPHG